MSHKPRVSPGWLSTPDGAHLRGRRSRDTAPEVALRSAVHRLGLRVRKHQRLLPRTTVDFTLPRHRVAVEVDGCFWHGCPVHGAREFRGPNKARWERKMAENRARDDRASSLLADAGWTVLRFWECEVKSDAQRCALQVLAATRAINPDPGVP